MFLDPNPLRNSIVFKICRQFLTEIQAYFTIIYQPRSWCPEVRIYESSKVAWIVWLLYLVNVELIRV